MDESDHPIGALWIGGTVWKSPIGGAGQFS